MKRGKGVFHLHKLKLPPICANHDRKGSFVIATPKNLIITACMATSSEQYYQACTCAGIQLTVLVALVLWYLRSSHLYIPLITYEIIIDYDLYYSGSSKIII